MAEVYGLGQWVHLRAIGTALGYGYGYGCVLGLLLWLTDVV